MLDTLFPESRSAVRRVIRGLPASIVSVAALACGIGAAAATWSLMNALLLNPLTVTDAESLFVVGLRPVINGQQRTIDSHSYRDYPWIRDIEAFEQFGAGGSVGVTGPDGESFDAYFASHDLFETLGVRIALGRSFAESDDVRGAPLTVVLSDAFWQQRYDGDPDILGRTITVGGLEALVIGVAPAGFRGLSLARSPQLYLPLHSVADVTADYLGGFVNYFAEPIPPATSSPSSWLTFVGRIARGTSAAATADQVKVAFLDAYPELAESDFQVALTPINAAAVPAAAREGMRQFVLLLAGTVALLMLAGCLSAGMLLLVRTEARRDELATARALGASSPRIAIGIAAEGALLASAGALAAIVVALWLFRGIRAFDLPGGVPVELLSLTVDGPLLTAIGIGAAVAMATITIIAVTFASSVEVTGILGARAVATPRRTRFGARSWLVIGQVAAALVLLAGTGLFARSLIAALTLNPGYDTGRIVTGLVPFPSDGSDQLYDELLQRLDANPAIESASLIENQGGMTTAGQLEVDGIPQRFPATVEYRGIDEQYFSTMRLPIIEGRGLSSDDRAASRPVAVVSESLARVLAAADGRAIGRQVSTGRGDDVVEVVGVVPDIITDVNSLEPLMLYRPTGQGGFRGPRTLVLRPASDPAAAIGEASAVVRNLSPDTVPRPMRTINEQLVSQLGAQRFGAVVMGALGGIAVLLTAMCIYVLAESIGLGRRREFGIRAALGARGTTLAGNILFETIRLAGIGTIVGLVISWAGARAFRAFLFQVGPLDAVTLMTVAGLMLVLALLVSLRPAVAAMRVDLVRLLRDE